ncbi:signal recognition particle receptor subunit alpha [Candidatus Pacearchaeota archaeon]|nr:signal recognition particle receptor subunit alpha [Candidatus Pacearchaeota archaeon]
MLDNLSNAIKKATDKIANAIFLDKNLINSVIKDLQRSLIEVDVNVQLVLNITQKIKKSALDERLKGIEKKEHIIKLLHDELKEILGERRELKLKSGQINKFMMLGLYGSGKCIHGNTNVQLSNGNIKKIKEIYEENISNNEERLEDGFIIDISNQNLLVPSFNPNTLKIENKRVTDLWKLKKEDLYEISLDNGNDFSIKVTPEHPFFVLRNGQVIKTRAEELNNNDWIATPQKVKVEGKNISIEENLKKLPISIILPRREIKQIIEYHKQTIKQINKNLIVKRNYCKFTQELKCGQIPIELVDNLPNIILAREKNASKIITIPTLLNLDFAEFLGYVMGDGNIRPQYIQISNEDPEIINRIKELTKILFNIEPTIKFAKRTEKMYDIRICSTTLVKIMSIFGLFPGKKGKNLSIPQEILLSDNETVRQFIKAYFDCDSYASPNRYIELTSESHIIIEQFNMILKRFGIVSTISKKIINLIPYWRLAIKSRYAEKYAEKIGYLIGYKREKVEKYKDIGLIQGCGNQDMIPFHTFLKETRQSMGFSIGEIQDNAVYSFGTYENKGSISKEQLKKLVNYYRLTKKGMYSQFLEKIQHKNNIKQEYGTKFLNGIKKHLQNTGLAELKENEWVISNIGQKYLQQIKETKSGEIIQNLSNLANSEVCWLPIKNISKIKNNEEYVYDLTVEDNHSFIAEGFIVHNTTTISKLALYYSKRGSKVCAIGLDVHRPAASTQLKQLCDKINIACFIKPEEKDPTKIWKEYEKELSKYDLILIDTAGRDALEASLIKEIKSIAKIAKPTETLLVIPADIGQTARKQAITFKEAVSITGVIITRMDSTAKAGGALTSCYEAKVPVIFIGTGEKPADLEQFNPESFLSRMLGMGDLESLMEKIHTVTDEQKLKKTQKNIEEGKLTLRDVQSQLESMESLGSMDKIMSMIPGLGKAKEKISSEKLEQQQQKLKGYKHAINSMTKEEIENPEIMEKETSRIQRVSKGSGVSTTDIRNLIKQYKMLKEMLKSGKSSSSDMLDQKNLMKMAKKLAKKGMKI